MSELELARDGAEHYPAKALGALDHLRCFAAGYPSDRAGIRLHGDPDLDDLLHPAGAIASIAKNYLGDQCRAVRAVLFDKTAAANWALGWHQDRTISVASRVEVPGFGPWTVKQGLIHVTPPISIIERMVTLRVHLDDVPESNAPLLIAPGTHRLGMVAEGNIKATVAQHGQVSCCAKAGDVWAYSTPILHASCASEVESHRRVLQVDFAAEDLPGGLLWLGV